jgi:hypothetical protein
VEKLVYVLWKRRGQPSAELARALLDEVAPRLAPLVRAPLSVLVVDAHAEAVQKARITKMEDPIAGMIGVWLDCVDERGALEAALRPHVGRTAGYLVTESVPLRNTTHRAPLGQRTPGITMLTCIERPERLTQAEWIEIWHGRHSPLALEIQCTYSYVRNVVARALTRDAPPWAGIVEEGFPADAVVDPMRWYKADGDPAKLRENLGRMLASVRAFLDIERVESHPMSEYLLG